ncbi:hypothetical protein Catovirus_2_16 [Catovirus CTV1]|uniref:Uncharacterized protein n=1 Tax=Catovirus CTV1 TaxID=1977631 RepID=A0A1V0SBG9_9VIRU|nr:hypothetical protein Catovirus_2_16 [Catovirus CTV1]
MLSNNSIKYGNIGVCSLHGITDENCYIKLKKNQTVIINFFSNIATQAFEEFEDETVFYDKNSIDISAKDKTVPEYYLWNKLFENVKKCSYENFDHNECLNKTVNLLNKMNPENKFGLFTGNDIDYKLLSNPILQRNISVDYVPNILLYRDNKDRDFAQYFYDYTENKTFLFRKNINQGTKYIISLKELIEKYYNDNEFILFVTSCRTPKNDISRGQIHNGIIIDHNFQIENYLMSKEESQLTKKNFMTVYNYYKKYFRDVEGFEFLIKNLNNKELNVMFNFIKTNELLNEILQLRKYKKKFNNMNNIEKIKENSKTKYFTDILEDLQKILNRCKYIDISKNREYHINYSLYELSHTNILEVPEFDDMSLNNHKNNVTTIENIYRTNFGYIVKQLKKIFNLYYDNKINDDQAYNCFNITSLLILVFQIMISQYSKYIKNDFVNLYSNFTDIIQVIFDAVINPSVLNNKLNPLYAFLNEFVNKQKDKFIKLKKQSNSFINICVIFYEIKQMLLDKKNDLFDNPYILNGFNYEMKNKEAGEIYKQILYYMQKLMFLKSFLIENQLEDITVTNNIFDNILDLSLEIIVKSAVKIYYSENLNTAVIKKYNVDYLLVEHEEEKDENISFLFNNVKKAEKEIDDMGFVKNLVSVKKLNIKRETYDYLAQKIDYDVTMNPCFLYEFVGMMRAKDLFKLSSSCYKRENTNELRKKILENMLNKYSF